MNYEVSLHKIKSLSGKVFTALKIGTERYKHTLSTTPTEIASMLGISLKEYWHRVKSMNVGDEMICTAKHESATDDDLPFYRG